MAKGGKTSGRAGKVDHLLDVATDLFSKHGYHGSGIDQVIAESGIAKTTLYRHFESKEALIIAVLKRIDGRFREQMRDFVDRHATEPREKILATFDFLEQWFADANFHGCPFMSAGSEFNDESSPIFHEARLHKRLMVAYFEELARAAKLPNPQRIAEEIHLLHEGATAIAHIMGDSSIAKEARASAARLIDCALQN